MSPEDRSGNLRKRRPRGYRIDVWVSQQERAEIVNRAACAGLSHSSFMRSVALNTVIRSVVDLDAADRLEKVNSDLGRVAGLLKLWLATKRGEGARPSEVDAMMREFRSLQKQLSAVIGTITYDR